MRTGWLLIFLASCGGGTQEIAPSGDTSQSDVSLLFFGNSHTHNHNVPGMVVNLVQAVLPSKKVAASVAPDYLFLDDRWRDANSQTLFKSQRWSAVILQAQRYSSSGTVSYSTAEAKAWSRAAREAGAVPVMFPEWPRDGIDETQRIYELHLSIARDAPACVPPIPQAFDVALTMSLGVPLHSSDGNHSSPAGALLAAHVIAATLTGQDPARAADVPGTNVESTVQAKLREAASKAMAATSPWTLCPADARLS